MAAVTELSSNVTEFAGDYKVVAVKVDGATNTTGTLTIDEMSTVVACFGQLAEAPTANAAHILVKPNVTTATNVLSCVIYEDDHVTASTQTAIDYFVLAIGY
jgi:hypothetical protein